MVLTCITMGGGIVGEMLTIYGSIRFYSSFPTHTYIFFPTVAVVIFICIYIALPDAIKVYEDTLTFIQRSEFETSRKMIRNKGYLSLKLRSFRPCKFVAGVGNYQFYFIKRSTKTTYFCIIINDTINLLLTFPRM
jgi:hypothetical protein